MMLDALSNWNAALSDWLTRRSDLDGKIAANKDAEAEIKAERLAMEAERAEIDRQIMAELESAGVVSEDHPLAKITIVEREGAPEIDEATLPDAFWKVRREPDKSAIKASAEPVPGVTPTTTRFLKITWRKP